jgi:hypothetical protein
MVEANLGLPKWVPIAIRSLSLPPAGLTRLDDDARARRWDQVAEVAEDREQQDRHERVGATRMASDLGKYDAEARSRTGALSFGQWWLRSRAAQIAEQECLLDQQAYAVSGAQNVLSGEAGGVPDGRPATDSRPSSAASPN